ncbi:mitochondrial cardiolipin hydrolase-like [Acanthaster planci]|uniref:Mitochondrial cardiolipin hydrolase n=1 Tax=Acanthaster planci TaxID=133434 RepID=A0A8B7Y7W4_ACAPL|nr:mitochondrial cardiolipin hydrolase-like [Acanthaster planci]
MIGFILKISCFTDDVGSNRHFGMSLRSWITVVFAFGVGLFSEVLYYLYKRKVHQQMLGHFTLLSAAATRQSSNTSNVFHHVLFFPDTERTCPDHFLTTKGCWRPKCPFSHEVTNFSRMVEYILNAKHSLDICMYTITNSDLAELVIGLHERGIVVRIITDDEAQNTSGTFIGRFRRDGIQVRRDYSSYLMHHKFVVIDGMTLINGSFNWTCHAVNSNNENVLITNNPDIVQPFIAEYERLWDIFDPAKRPL